MKEKDAFICHVYWDIPRDEGRRKDDRDMRGDLLDSFVDTLRFTNHPGYNLRGGTRLRRDGFL